MPCSIVGLQPATLTAIDHTAGAGHGLARQTAEQQYRRSAWAALECWRWRRRADPASVAHPALVAAHPPGSDRAGGGCGRDRKSTRLNSSHVRISYAVFCLKKKRK